MSTNILHRFYESAVLLASKVGVEPPVTQITGCQTHCNNVLTETTKEYYLIAVRVSFVDHLVSSLEDRFDRKVV